ncbi:winged helix-turn-helix domain-containing protein [Rheinheimera sp. 4Y26]|uniref:winged helix-turn-helix domain-containing protein n=1 Tax=Rheinheimera sp. 4Y26 TaxID=2977811 RepID=UPI0021B0DBD4|nr:winged helix-turn-helix domain-containing protein [Rheinheimera sp. 4Y26]MCT6701209.1 winged helix-turn-helix domain-containing protein [Rheinheimera sp. 4Y26]
MAPIKIDVVTSEAVGAEIPDGELQLLSGGLVILPKSQHVFYDGKPLPLKGLTYRLLERLVLAQQQLVSADELARSVWHKSYVSDETLAQRVSLLRKALSFLQAEVIESVRSEGYRWLLPVVKQITTPPIVAKPDNTDFFAGAVQANGAAKADSTAQVNNAAQANSAARLMRAPQGAAPYFYLAVLLLLLIAAWFYLAKPSLSHSNNLAEPAQPALLQKAFGYARQNTASGNEIAIELFEEFLQQSPDHTAARLALAAATIERVVKFNGEPLLLERAADQISHLATTDVSRWQLEKLTGYYFDAQGDIAQAIYHYEQALAANSGAISEIAASLAYLYVRKGRMYEAMQLNLTVLNNKNGYTFLQIAEILYLTGFTEQAKVWAEVAYKIAPDDAFVATQYARDAKARGQTEVAYQALNKLEQFQSATADSYITLAVLAMQDQQWQQAEQALEKATALEANSLYAQSLSYWLSKKNHVIAAVIRPLTEHKTPVWPNWHIAKSIVHLADDDSAAAKQAIATALAAGFSDYQYLLALPVFQPLFADAEFQQLIQQMRHSVTTERSKIATISLPDPAALMLAE